MIKLKFNYGVILLSGVLFAIISQIVHSIGALAGNSYYTNTQLTGLWSNLMMPNGGAPGAEFFIVSLLFGVITGIIFAMVYIMIKEGIQANTLIKKGLLYGLFLFLIAGIPGYLSSFLILSIPQGLLLMWTLENLIIYLATGILFVKLNK